LGAGTVACHHGQVREDPACLDFVSLVLLLGKDGKMTYHKKGGESDSDEHAHSCCFLVYPPELLSVFQPCGSDGSFVGFEPYPPRLKGCWKFIFHSFAGGYRQCLIFHPGSMTHRLHLEGKRDW